MSARDAPGRGSETGSVPFRGMPGGRGPMGGRGHMGGGPGFAVPGEKARDFKGALRRLAAYLSPHRPALAAALALAVAGTAFSVAGPKILGRAITLIFEGAVSKASPTPGAGIDFPRVGGILISLLGLYLASSAFSFVNQYVMAGVSQRTVYGLRKDVDEKLSRLPLRFFDGKTHGEILSRVTNDVDTISNTLQQSLVQIITSVVTLAGSVAMMFTISWKLSLVAVGTLPFYALATSRIARKSHGHFKNQQERLGRLNGHVEEMYSGHAIVKAFGREERSVGEFDRINGDLYDAAWRAQFLTGIIMPLMNLINNVGYVFIAVLGGFMAARRAIDLGDIQSFVQYARQFTHPVIQTANISNILQSTLAAAERVFELLDEAEEEPDARGAGNFGPVRGEVEFDRVSFGYETGRLLMDGLSLRADPGAVVAIVGPTGAGKTTLVNLLLRFYELSGGSIRLDGTDIRSVPRGVLRRSFGMVLQDTWLFHGTIRENIAYGQEGAEEGRIVAAAEAAHADHFIRTLPEGYETVLNEEASNLSHGQKQLLTIARAFLADPAVLILDEATSSVDTRTELIIRGAMERLRKGRTTFVIAHRLSTVRGADRILVMNEGSIVESGSHGELLAAEGFYAELYRSQWAGAEEADNRLFQTAGPIR